MANHGESWRIMANHGESRSVTLALTNLRFVRGIRQRSAERLTRASGARRKERGEEKHKHGEKAYTRIIQYSLEDSSPDT